MARGKHSGKNLTFFGDENYYKRNRYNDEDENIENNEDSKYSFKEETSNDYNYNSSYNNSNEYDEEQDDDTYDDYDDEGYFNKKKIIKILLIVLVLIIIALLCKNIFAKKEKIDANTITSNSSSMTAQFEGYKVLGQIKIDKLGITQYILDSTEEGALEKAVGKLYGGSLNNYGNFCIVGHNYSNIFANLSELNEGDTFTIIDKKMQETKYRVTKTYSVEPDNLDSLLQNDNKIEITLITCKDGSTERLIVKAEKMN